MKQKKKKKGKANGQKTSDFRCRLRAPTSQRGSRCWLNVTSPTLANSETCGRAPQAASNIPDPECSRNIQVQGKKAYSCHSSRRFLFTPPERGTRNLGPPAPTPTRAAFTISKPPSKLVVYPRLPRHKQATAKQSY